MDTMIGIAKTLEVFDDITKLIVSGVVVYKQGVGLKSLMQLGSIIDSLTELVKDIPPALPELKDLDKEESARLGAATYSMLRTVAEALEA